MEEKWTFELRQTDVKLHETRESLIACWKAEALGNLTYCLLPVEERQMPLLFSLEEAFQDRMSFVADEYRLFYQETLLRACFLGQLFAIKLGEELVGLLLLRDVEHQGEQKTLLSWVWARQGMGAKKADFKMIVRQILHQFGHAKVIANIHKENRRSQAFHSSLGFEELHL